MAEPAGFCSHFHVPLRCVAPEAAATGIGAEVGSGSALAFEVYQLTPFAGG